MGRAGRKGLATYRRIVSKQQPLITRSGSPRRRISDLAPSCTRPIRNDHRWRGSSSGKTRTVQGVVCRNARTVPALAWLNRAAGSRSYFWQVLSSVRCAKSTSP